MPAGPDTTWQPSEIAALRSGHKAGMSPREIRDRRELRRSVKAVKMKMLDLGLLSRGRVVLDPIKGREPDRIDMLLPALLRYGVRHKVDLGMGAERFYAACAEHGVRV